MSERGIEQQVTGLLAAANELGGYAMSLVCTDQGLLVACAGDPVRGEEIAGFTALFDDIVGRAERDLSVQRVDEVTLLDPGRGRIIVRPLPGGGPARFFLVVRAPAHRTWRRHTNLLCKRVGALLDPLVVDEAAP